MGKVFIKMDVLGPYWGIGGRVNFTQTCAGSGLLPPCARLYAPRCPKLTTPML